MKYAIEIKTISGWRRLFGTCESEDDAVKYLDYKSQYYEVLDWRMILITERVIKTAGTV